MFPSFPSLNIWQWLFIILWLHRYTRLIINTISHWVYRSIPIPSIPSYTSQDVTVIIPTIHNNFPELRESLLSILLCHPHELIIVTTADKYHSLLNFTRTLSAPNLRCFSVPIANKRLQVCEAIPRVKTAFTIMADDDVTWPRTIIAHLLAPFESPAIGAVGPCQRVRRLPSTSPLLARIFNFLGAAYIERRNFEISATHGIDRGTSCMSGRTCAFRSEILQSVGFREGFKTEMWGRWRLNADDDNFITRWLVANGWATWIQYKRECEIETTLEDNWKFLFQCSRWARSNWRSNWTSLVRERFVWRKQPYSTYALHIATFTSLSFAFDPLILFLCWKATSPTPFPAITSSTLTFTPALQATILSTQLIFMLFSKIIKLLSLFLRNPSDLCYLPCTIIFGYFHGLIKIYALLTLRMTSWGSRADGDTHNNHRMTPLPRSRRSESLSFLPTLSSFRTSILHNNDEHDANPAHLPSSFLEKRERRKSSPARVLGCGKGKRGGRMMGLWDARKGVWDEKDLLVLEDEGYGGSSGEESEWELAVEEY